MEQTLRRLAGTSLKKTPSMTISKQSESDISSVMGNFPSLLQPCTGIEPGYPERVSLY